MTLQPAPAQLAPHLSCAAARCSHQPPFTAHALYAYTLPGVAALQAALQAAFPGCDDLSRDPARGIDAFTPHLSVGQWRDAAAAQAAIEQVRAAVCLSGKYRTNLKQHVLGEWHDAAAAQAAIKQVTPTAAAEIL